MLHTGEKEGKPIFVFIILGECSGVACLLGLLGGILVNSPLAQRENSPLPRYSCPPPLKKGRKIRKVLLAGTTEELPTSTVLLPSSPTERRKISYVLLAGTTGELPTSLICLDSSPTKRKNCWQNGRLPPSMVLLAWPPPLYRKEKNKIRTPRLYKGRTPHFHDTVGLLPL
jgi:hypothetical protein